MKFFSFFWYNPELPESYSLRLIVICQRSETAFNDPLKFVFIEEMNIPASAEYKKITKLREIHPSFRHFPSPFVHVDIQNHWRSLQFFVSSSTLGVLRVWVFLPYENSFIYIPERTERNERSTEWVRLNKQPLCSCKNGYRVGWFCSSAKWDALFLVILQICVCWYSSINGFYILAPNGYCFLWKVMNSIMRNWFN